MKIDEGNANKTTRIDKRFSISIILALVMFMISGSITAAAMTNAYGQTSQVLPNCTDPTGHNLQCIVFISTLPPPTNTKLCQETSGQIFKCNYIVETLKNGLQIVVITVYVPTNYVVTGSENFQVLKVKVTVTENRSEHDSCRDGLILHGGWCFLKLDCPPGSHQVFFGDLSWCSWPPICPQGQIWNSTTSECQKPTTPPPPLTPPVNTTGTNTTQSQAKTNVTGNVSAPAIAPAAVVPPPSSNNTNNTTSIGHHLSKTKSSSNLTQSSVTPPPVSVPPIPPTTKTCADGSVIDASANCPTQSTPPTNPGTPSTPPSTSGTPPSNNPAPPPSSSNNGGGGSSSGSGGSGSGGGGSGGSSTSP